MAAERLRLTVGEPALSGEAVLDDGARPGLIRLVPMLPSALAVGALAGATVMAWRTSTGRSTHRWSLVLAAALLLDLAWLGLLVS